MRYNLLDEGWIPVIDLAGRRRLVGVRQALREASQIERIGPAMPLEEVVLTRLLLAILHRALNGPRHIEEVLEIYKSGCFPEYRVAEYLDRFEHRFDLFDPNCPFLQVRDLDAHVEPLPWTKLMSEYAQGSNPTLFDHSMDDSPTAILPARAAICILVHQAYAPAGLMRRLGVTSTRLAPLGSLTAFFVVGRSLFETLLLNLIPYSDPDDIAIWERDPYCTDDLVDGKARAPLRGVARVYTWMCRGIKLLPDSDGLIRNIAYGPGVEVMDSPFRDPMVAHQSTGSSVQPFTASAGRAFWRDFEALLPGEQGWVPPQVLEHAITILRELGQSSQLIPLTVVSHAVDRRRPSKVLDVKREVYPFPVRAMDPDTAAYITEALNLARDVQSLLHRAAWNVAQNLLTLARRQAAAEDIRTLVQSLPLESEYWSALERAFLVFLKNLSGGDPEVAVVEWGRAVREGVQRAWNLTAASLGSMSRHFKALAAGERVVREIVGGLAAHA